MVQNAMTEACDKARAQGARPISAVDDLTIHSVGRWIDVFGQCLARSARREGISVVGGEMAQMPDSYAAGYAGVIISVVSLRLS
jgi:phosphoribosylaminoimidazole (AIR) synthetase